MIAKVLLVVGSGVVAGTFQHQFGVAPILGAILCAAFFLRPWELFGVGLGGIFFRDLLAGFSSFTVVRLIGMAAVVAAVLLIRVRPNLRSVLTGLLVSSPIFHLTLAAGDWWTGTCSAFPRNAQGLWMTVLTAFPYFVRSFAGDLLFSGIFLAFYTVMAYGLFRKVPLAES